MDPTWILSLPEYISVASDVDGELTLSGGRSPVTLRQLCPAVLDALRRFAGNGESAGELTNSIGKAAGPSALPRWFYLLQNLARQRLLRFSVDAGDKRLATLEPTSHSFVLPPKSAHPGRTYVLSRYAWIQRRGDKLALESPLSPGRIMLHDPRAAAFIHALAIPGRSDEIAGRVAGLEARSATALLGLLAHIGAACLVEEDGSLSEDSNQALGSWQFHDLLFHTRSREGRHDEPAGATYPFAGRFDPPPAHLPESHATAISLCRPDLDKLERQDPPFAFVQENRRSIRRYGAEPISECQLSEFLYRVARVKESHQMEVSTPAGTVRMDFSTRPYPSGGSLYELEVYVAISACRGLSPGLYRYDGLDHRLVNRAGWTAEVASLLSKAALAARLENPGPQVLLILAARMPRIAWKYTGLAYALVLKHVGVVFQTMYLAATAMKLAPCAVGLGDSDLFAQASGLNYYAETSVGEFLLGSVPQE